MESEAILGAALKDRRRQVCLVTKVESTKPAEVRKSVQTSLKTLQTDHLDITLIAWSLVGLYRAGIAPAPLSICNSMPCRLISTVARPPCHFTRPGVTKPVTIATKPVTNEETSFRPVWHVCGKLSRIFQNVRHVPRKTSKIPNMHLDQQKRP